MTKTITNLFQANNGGRWIAEFKLGTVTVQQVVADYRATEAQARERAEAALAAR